MAKQRPKRRPAETPEARESQLVSAAYDLAERQIFDGTASSQVMTHFLKVGSTRDRIERQKLDKEVQMLQAKIDYMESAQRVEELYGEAMVAFRSYSGQEDLDNGDPYE